MEKDSENNETVRLDVSELDSSVIVISDEEINQSGGGDFNTSLKRKREVLSPGDSEDSEITALENSSSGADDEEDFLNSERMASSNVKYKGEEQSIPDVVINKPSKLEIDENLPETVCLLTTDWGSKVYLVGTSHFSRESQEDVAKIIQAVQPNYVVVELCKSRAHMLTWEEEQILSEAKSINFQKMTQIVHSHGVVQGAMYLMLLSVSAHITRELGMAPGGEFRRAFKEAQAFPNCIINLGDRPIHITINRAIASLTWWQSIKLTYHLLFNKGPISKEDVEKCKKRDFLETIIAEMAGEYPELKKVFVNERDMYLTYSLQIAAMLERGLHGPQATTVVGVVGIGHMPGIQQHWGKLKESDILPILKVPPTSRSSKFLKFTLKASVICCVLYGLKKLLPVPLPDWKRWTNFK